MHATVSTASAAPTRYSSRMPKMRPPMKTPTAVARRAQPCRVSNGGSPPLASAELAARWNGHRGEHVLHDPPGIDALQLGVGRQHEAMGEHGDRERLDVVGDDVVATRRRGARPGGA